MNINITGLTGISDLHHHREWFHQRLNEMRWDRFEKQEPLFGIEYNNIPFGESPLPKADQWKIAIQNAEEIWKTTIRDFFFDTTIQIENEYTSIDSTSFPTCIKDKRLRISDFTVEENKIQTDNLTIHLSTSSETLESEDRVIVNYNDNIIETGVQYNASHVHEENHSKLQKVFTKAVASGALETTQIVVRNSDGDFPSFFEKLDVDYKRIRNSDRFSTYIIGNKDRDSDIISDFVSNPPSSFAEYCDFFGFPVELNRYTKLRNVDAISSEEFAIYLYEDSKFNQSDLESFILCPYTPPPSKRHAKLAAQLGEQIRLGAICKQKDEKLVQDAIEHNIKNIPKSRVPFSAPFSAPPINQDHIDEIGAKSE